MTAIHSTCFMDKALWSLEKRGRPFGEVLDESLAWCLDRAVENVLSRRIEGAVCFGRFSMTRSDNFPPGLRSLVAADEPELLYETFASHLGASGSLSRFKDDSNMRYRDVGKSKLVRFKRFTRQSAARECLRVCLSEGRAIPDDPFMSRTEARRIRFRDHGCFLSDDAIEWFEANEPELFASALKDTRRVWYEGVAGVCEGIVMEMMNIVPLFSDDPVFVKYDPPLLPLPDKVVHFGRCSLSMVSVFEALGYVEPYPFGIKGLVRKDGIVHVDMDSDFFSSKYADSDLAFVTVEALKAGYAPADACDWEAGEEYVSRLANALRLGIPFADLIAGEERERFSWIDLGFVGRGA